MGPGSSPCPASPPSSSTPTARCWTCMRRWRGTPRGSARTGRRVSADWRAKQIEYTWVRSLAGREHHRDFWRLTEEALAWTAARHGITDAALLADVLLRLSPARRLSRGARRAAPPRRSMGISRAILSNGEPAMLGDAVRAAGIDIGAGRCAQRRDGRRVQAGPAGLSACRRLLRWRAPGDGLRLVQPLGRVRRGELRFSGVLAESRRQPRRIRPAHGGDRAARPGGSCPTCWRDARRPHRRRHRPAGAIAAQSATPSRGRPPMANDYSRTRRFIGAAVELSTGSAGAPAAG